MFKFTKGTKKQQRHVMDANQAIADMKTNQETSTEIETILSIPDHWNVTEESRYVYAFHNNQSPKLKKNQISIYGMELMKQADNHLMITGLVRSTVTQNIQFEKTTILLLDRNEKALAKREFDLKKLGTLPPNSARPWEFEFLPDHFIVDEVEDLGDDWKLAFEIKSKHRLDLEPSWEKSLNEQSKAALENIVAQAPALKENEVNLMGVKAEFNEQEDLVVTILIRNGNQDKNINLEQLPLKVMDATDTEVARGAFKLGNLTVKANTSKPWSFIFPKATIQKQPDFSRWKVIAVQEK